MFTVTTEKFNSKADFRMSFAALGSFASIAALNAAAMTRLREFAASEQDLFMEKSPNWVNGDLVIESDRIGAAMLFLTGTVE